MENKYKDDDFSLYEGDRIGSSYAVAVTSEKIPLPKDNALEQITVVFAKNDKGEESVSDNYQGIPIQRGNARSGKGNHRLRNGGGLFRELHACVVHAERRTYGLQKLPRRSRVGHNLYRRGALWEI
jgi:hypothetical protein